MLTEPLMTLSSIVFQVTSNGGPNGPAPPTRVTPPLIELKWICTEAAFVERTPPLIVPVWAGFSSLPSTNVAPSATDTPPLIVTGPANVRHAAPAGTTTFW